jgi:hypothetical protein
LRSFVTMADEVGLLPYENYTVYSGLICNVTIV